MAFYNQDTDHVLKKLGTTEKGLSTRHAKDRLDEYGPNAITVKGEPLWRKLLEPFWNVFMLVLFVAGVISLFHGDRLDAIIIFSIIVITAVIYYVQRFSTERILRALQKKSQQNVSVKRNNKYISIDAERLVPGDIVSLSEGEKVPADTRIVHASNLRVDESLLTGESTPVSKHARALEGKKEVYEQSNMLFQGSYVIAGETLAVVTGTGNDSEFGHLAELSSPTAIKSPVQKKIDKLLSQIIVVVTAISVVAFALSIWRGMELADTLRFVLSLAVSAVPEGLPVAITVVLVLGMRRMAKRKALVRHMRAIETIGVITTIATDKTGTLTKNKLTVQEVWHPTGIHDDLLERMALATNTEGKMHDPLDGAMQAYTRKHEASIPEHYKHNATLPFDQAEAMSGNVWKVKRGYEITIKGAPEYVIARSEMSDNEAESITHELHSLTARGFRVIALAHASLKKEVETFADIPDSTKFRFTGLVAVADVLRPEAKAAVRRAESAGVTVRMITGDHFETAYAIGRELGMVENRSQVFDSRKMNDMSDEELTEVLKDIRVFSRVIPEYKYRILSILKEHDITAMTGDGVNDVPALSNADIGVAMGSGSQIAKEAGAIILLDDNFRSIINAMKEGRTIYRNIRRMLFYLLSTNSGEVLTMIGALLIGMPLPVVAVQILWMNLITDTAMVIPLGLEPAEKDTMKQKPRPPKSPLLDKFIISRMILLAVIMAIVALMIFYIFIQSHSIDYARTVAFNALVTMQWARAMSARSEMESLFTYIKTRNWVFYAGLSIAIILQILVMFGPLGPLLSVVPVAIPDLLITMGIGIVIIFAVEELHKLVGRRM